VSCFVNSFAKKTLHCTKKSHNQTADKIPQEFSFVQLDHKLCAKQRNHPLRFASLVNPFSNIMLFLFCLQLNKFYFWLSFPVVFFQTLQIEKQNPSHTSPIQIGLQGSLANSSVTC